MPLLSLNSTYHFCEIISLECMHHYIPKEWYSTCNYGRVSFWTHGCIQALQISNRQIHELWIISAFYRPQIMPNLIHCRFYCLPYILTWPSNFIHDFLRNIITHPYPIFNSGLIQPPISGHEWVVITSHRFMLMWSLIHALYSTCALVELNKVHKYYILGPILLTWFNLNPIMDK